MILGPSGAGKTTLGRRTAQRLGLAFVDIDEFIWGKDTPKPFTAMFSRAEKIARLQQAVSQAGRFVMAGSMDSFHQHFDPYFRLAVYLTAPAALRVERVHRRELEAFGPRVLPGGDMEEDHSLSCKVIRLDGAAPIESNAEAICQAWWKVMELVKETGK